MDVRNESLEKIDMDGLSLKELDLPRSIEKKCQLLRAQVLGGQELKEELANYISISGAYWVTDTVSFDMEKKAREFIKSDLRQLILMGYPGGGKSTFLRHLHKQLWEEYQAGGIISIFVSLPMIVDPEQSLMKEALSEAGFTMDEIDFIKDNRELCIILDGYEEAHLSINIVMTNKLFEWKNSSIFLTSHPHFHANFNYNNSFFISTNTKKVQPNLIQTVTVAPFTNAQIEGYITKYIEISKELKWKSTQEWITHIQSVPGLQELIKTPLLLKISLDILHELIESYKPQPGAKQIKISQTTLYDAFVEHWFRREEKILKSKGLLPQDGRDIKEDFWEFSKALGTYMHRHQICQVSYNAIESSSSTAPWSMFFSNDNLDVMLARSACPLKKVGPHHWMFIHSTFASYFSSKATYDEMMEEDFEADVLNKDESGSLIPKNRVDDKASTTELAEIGESYQKYDGSTDGYDASKDSVSYSKYGTNHE